MKSGTETKLKFIKLMNALGLKLWEAGGLLDAMWRFTAHNCPAGDIGRFKNEDIALAIQWDRTTPDVLVEALVENHWLDRSEQHRLIVHDWQDHCEDGVHNNLARKRGFFANGAKPKLTRLSKEEREPLQEFYRTNSHDTRLETLGNASERSPNAQPCLALPSPAKPIPALGAARSGVFSKLAEADLKDTGKMLAWQQHAAAQKKPVIGTSVGDSHHVLGAAELGIETGAEPVGLFAKTILEKRWDWITNAQADRAAERFKTANKPRDGTGDNHLARAARELAAKKKLQSEGEA